MKTNFIVREPVFLSSCTILVGWTLEEVRKLIEANSLEKIDWEDMKGCNGVCISANLKNGSFAHLVWLRDFDMTTSSISTLSHELNHLVFEILNHKGVPLRYENQEVFTYLQQFYFADTLKILQKKINEEHARTKKPIRRSKAKKGGNNSKRR